jgi:hypothetical protein
LNDGINNFLGILQYAVIEKERLQLLLQLILYGPCRERKEYNRLVDLVGPEKMGTVNRRTSLYTFDRNRDGKTSAASASL